jgi:hypothetical protein
MQFPFDCGQAFGKLVGDLLVAISSAYEQRQAVGVRAATWTTLFWAARAVSQHLFTIVCPTRIFVQIHGAFCRGDEGRLRTGTGLMFTG